MPHRVVNFFRSSNENISLKKQTAASLTRNHRIIPRSTRKNNNHNNNNSSSSSNNCNNNNNIFNNDRRSSYARSIESQSTYATDSEDSSARNATNMQEAVEAAGNYAINAHVAVSNQSAAQKDSRPWHRRLSFNFGKRDHAEDLGAKIDWVIESNDVLFHDDAEHSSGAWLSGQLLLEIFDDSVELDMFEATFKIHVTQKRPFHHHCEECTHQYTDLQSWNFITHPTHLRKGIHRYPFSCLLPGHLPSSMDSPVLAIAYEFNAEAVIARNLSSKTTSVTPISFERTVEVRRSLPESDLPHHSVRIFPPTSIKAGAHYTQVLHPKTENNISMRLEGLTSKREISGTIEFWKLKRVTWKLEETVRTVAPACEKHNPGGQSPSGGKKGIERGDTRVIGERSITSGWKSDYLANDGHVEFEFDFGFSESRQGRRFACDSKSRDGTQVSHNLMVELVVSREWAPVNRPELCTQTGTGRILRMHYRVVVTEQPGSSVSWDNECPPTYQDVPPSPPAYPAQAELVGYEDLETLHAERDSVEDVTSTSD